MLKRTDRTREDQRGPVLQSVSRDATSTTDRMQFATPTTTLRAQVLEEFRARRTPWGCVATVPDEPIEPEPEEPAPRRGPRRIVVARAS